MKQKEICELFKCCKLHKKRKNNCSKWREYERQTTKELQETSGVHEIEKLSNNNTK